jgi:hypothetical protein
MSEYKDFRKRIGIDASDKKIFQKFKSTIINSLKSNMQGVWKFRLEREFCRNYCKDISPRFPPQPHDFIFSFPFNCSGIFLTLKKEDDIGEFLYYLERFLRFLKSKSVDKAYSNKKMERFKESYNNIVHDLENATDTYPLKFRMKETEDGIVFYQSGDKLFDKLFIDDALDWLDKCPEAKDSLLSALEKYNRKIYERNLLDDARLSLELFLRKILNNDKSLEKQESEILQFFKKKKVSCEISNMFWTLLDYYTKYQNEHVKHDDKVDPKEVEFILYLTGLFIRFTFNLTE